MSCESNCGPLTVTLLTGAPGVQGAQGSQGPAGPQGPQGPQGPAGSVGTVTGDLSITTEGVATLATVGLAAVVGDAAKALTLQVDEKGRLLAATAQAISITTAQVQDLSLATLGGVATTDPRLTDARTPTGAASGDLSGTYPGPTLATVGTAGVTGAADKALLIQTDAKGRVLAATAQAISITTAQVQDLSLATLGGVATTDPRLSDSRTPSGAAGGDLAGTYPNPTLSTVTTAGSAGSATVVPVVTIDAKGRVTSLGSAQIAALTTAEVAGLSTATPAAIATTGAVGVEMFAARADHVHALTTLGVAGTFGSSLAVPVVTVDAFGRVASVATAEALSLTTADAAPLGAVASAGVSTLAARSDHVHALPTAAQIGALTTAQIQSLSTSTPETVATAGVVGLSVYPARQDHQHALATIGEAGTFGSSSAVPVVTVDAFGRVASVTTAEITGGGGAPVATDLPLGLATAGVAGIGPAPAAWDHRHPVSGDVTAGSGSVLTVTGLQSQPVASVTPTNGQVLTYDGTQWAPAAGGSVNVVTGSQISSFTGDGSTTDFAPLVGYTSTEVGNYAVSVGGIDQRPTVDYTISATGNGTIAFASAPPNGAPIVVRAYTGGTGGGATPYEGSMALIGTDFPGTESAFARGDHSHPVSGDLSSTPGALQVSGIQGVQIVSGSAGAFGSVLIGDGTALVWQTLTGDVFAGGPTPGELKVTGLRGREISMDAPSAGDTLIFNGTQWDSTPVPSPGNLTPGNVGPAATGVSDYYARADHSHLIEGDIVNNPNQSGSTLINLLQGNPISVYSPANNTVLQFQNGAWAAVDYKSFINTVISYLNTAFSANLTPIP